MKRVLRYPVSEKGAFFRISRRERIFLFAKSVLVVVILNHFFYRSVLALLPLSYIGFYYFHLERQYLEEKKREEAREQFKEMLLLVSKGQKAGYSVENAFLTVLPEMKELYGEGSSICAVLQMILIAKENRKSISEIWLQIGDRTDIREIKEFAQIYDISQGKSGNMSGIMEKTAEIIAGKIETEKEIRVLLGAKRLEQRIMNMMPLFIMFYMTVTSPGYFDELYHTLVGVIVMSICLCVYLVAYRASLKIVDIRL